MSVIKGKNALITGGASGIGRLMGGIMLEKELGTLVIWDMNPVTLQETEKALSSQGHHVITQQVDITDLMAIRQASEELERKNINIDILVNNAGIVTGKYFSEHSHGEIDRTMAVNSAAPMHLAATFLTGMLSRKAGHIVNIASAAGLVSNPKMSVYVASKWAITGWSDSLRLEMEELKTGVQITTVTPYYINTGMFDGVKSSIIPILDPVKAATKIISGIERDKIYVRMPGIVYFLPFVKGILPTRWFDVIVGKWLGVYKTMEDFRGRR